jgi:hypothetical protein
MEYNGDKGKNIILATMQYSYGTMNRKPCVMHKKKKHLLFEDVSFGVPCTGVEPVIPP